MSRGFDLNELGMKACGNHIVTVITITTITIYMSSSSRRSIIIVVVVIVVATTTVTTLSHNIFHLWGHTPA